MAMVTEDVGGIIHDAGLARMTAPVNMWSNTMGAAPDIAVGLYQSTAFDPENAMGRMVRSVDNLQVITRAPKATDSYNLSKAIFDLLHMLVVTRNGFNYTILARHTPHSIGEDENKRQKWSCNYKVSREAV